jgi:hypothetical protein
MMSKNTILRGLWTAAVTAGVLLVGGCGGGGSGSTEGAQSSFASSDRSFDYKSAKTVRFDDVITQMSTVVTLPADISATAGYVSIYVGTSEERRQLALLTVELYQSLVEGTSSTENIFDIPLGTTEVSYEIFGEDNSGNEVAASGSVTL